MRKRTNTADVELKVGISLKDLVAALQALSDEDRQFLVENLLAATSPEYLQSIQEAREDYQAGRTVSWAQSIQRVPHRR